MPSRKSPWIDVTIPFANGMHGWPGNPPTVIKPHAALAKGDVCNVSVFNLNTHAGTHMDSPWHFLKGLGTMDDLPFEAVIGPCRVVEIKDKESIKPAELAKLRLRKGERILFRTRNSEVSWKKKSFDKDFVYVSKEAAQYLVDKGIRTVGIDYFSVGGFYKDAVPTHHILLGKKVWIIEGLNLANAKPGRYEMICLPIRIAKSDGAPCRCILRPL
jgi:arylformamidase